MQNNKHKLASTEGLRSSLRYMWGDLWDMTATRAPGSVKAQNILSLLLDTTFNELIEQLDTTISKRSENEPVKRNPVEQKHIIKVYPNPANDEIIIELPESDSNWKLQIAGMLGSKTMNKILSSGQRKLVLNVKELPEGLYFYYIDNGKGISSNGKLVILR